MIVPFKTYHEAAEALRKGATMIQPVHCQTLDPGPQPRGCAIGALATGICGSVDVAYENGPRHTAFEALKELPFPATTPEPEKLAEKGWLTKVVEERTSVFPAIEGCFEVLDMSFDAIADWLDTLDAPRGEVKA